MNFFFKMVHSRWFWTVGLVALALFITPANSPLSIPRDWKVVPAVLIILALAKVWL